MADQKRTLRSRFNRNQSSTAMNYFTSSSYVPHAFQHPSNSSSKDHLMVLPSFTNMVKVFMGPGNPHSSQGMRAVSSSMVARNSQTAAQSPRTSMDLTSGGILSARGSGAAKNVRVRKSSQMLKRKQMHSGNINIISDNYQSGKTLETKDTMTQHSSLPKLHLQHPVPRDVDNFARDPLDVLQTNEELFGKRTHRVTLEANSPKSDQRYSGGFPSNDPNLLRKQAEFLQGVEIISDSAEKGGGDDELNYQFREEEEEDERLRRSMHRSYAGSANHSQIMGPQFEAGEPQPAVFMRQGKKAKKIRMMSPNLKEAYQQDGKQIRVTSPMSALKKAKKPTRQKIYETQLVSVMRNKQQVKPNSNNNLSSTTGLSSYANQINQNNARKSSKEGHSKKRKLRLLSPKGDHAITNEIQNLVLNPNSTGKRVSHATSSPRVSEVHEIGAVKIRPVYLESNFELAKKIQKLDNEVKQEEKNIKKFQLKKAQAESDKIEVMRDIATYEANACDSLDVKGIFTAMHNLVKQTKFKVNSLNGQKEQFLSSLFEKVSHGVNQIQEIASGMKYSHHLIQTKRGIKRLDATKRAGHGPKRSSAAMMLGNSSSVDTQGLRKGRDVEIEFFTQVISELNCSLRVKMKELTYNITCSPMVDLREPHTNMKIKIKRSDNDSMIEDARQYMKKLIILVNRSKQPMLYYANDLNKYPKSNFWHVLYKLKQDERCPFVTLRIISKKGEFGKQNMLIQVLDFLPGGAAHERLVNLQKVRVICESTVVVPMKAKTQIMFNQLPIDLNKLLIKRRNKDSFDFIIHYHTLDFKTDDLRLKEIQDLYNKLKPSKDNFSGKRGSVPDNDRSFSALSIVKDLASPGKPSIHRPPTSTISRRATVNDAIPVTQRLLDKEHMEILSNIDSQEEDLSEDEQIDKLKKMINQDAYKIEFDSHAPVINSSAAANAAKRKTRKSKFFKQEDLINLGMVQKDMYLHSKTKTQGIQEVSEEFSNSRNSIAESKNANLIPKPTMLMRFSTLYNIHLDPKISPLRPLAAFAKALSGSSNSLDYAGGSDEKDNNLGAGGGFPLIAIDDDRGEEEEYSENSLSSSVITPLVKGRYAKHREHWNTMMAKAQATPKYPNQNGTGVEGEEEVSCGKLGTPLGPNPGHRMSDELNCGLFTDDSLLEEDAEKGSEFISDVTSELLS